MAGKPQPLGKEFGITNPDGTPTDYFIRWAQERQLDISNSITLENLQLYLADHPLQEGTGINITPNGNLTNSPLIALDAVLDNLNDVDTVTTPPADGEVLKFSTAGNVWKPGTGGSGSGGALQLIAKKIIVNGDTTTSFTSIPQSYSDLIVVFNGNIVGSNVRLLMQINGFTTNIYDWELDSRFEYVTAFNTNSVLLGLLSGNGFNTERDYCEATIYNYQQVATKTVKGSSMGIGGGNYFSRFAHGRWRNTAPVSSLRIFPETGSFQDGEVLLYGRGGPAVANPPAGPGVSALAAVQFSVVGGVVTIKKQTNVSSVVRAAAGVYRINFATPLPDTEYSIQAAGRFDDFTNNDTPKVGPNRNTSGPNNLYTVNSVDITVSPLFDIARCSVLVYSASTPSALTGSSGTAVERNRVKPIVSQFTLQNAGTATITDSTNGVVLFNPAVAGANIRFVRNNATLPAAPYTVIMRSSPIDPTTNTVKYNQCMIARNGGTGALFIAGMYNNGLLGQRWTNYTTFAADFFSPFATTTTPPWHRMVVSATNVTFGVSPDGVVWWDYASPLISTIGAVTEIGFGCFANNATSRDIFESFEVTSP